MIVVYAANETDFTHNGLGPVEPVSCEVSETLNGAWELELTHPRDELGKHLRLAVGNIIKAPVPAGYTQTQPFRIYKTEDGISTVTAHARHIFYDLMDNLLDAYTGEGVTGAEAAAAILSHCRGTDHGFTMHSDLEAAGDVDFADKNPVEALLGSGGLTETFRAEIARDWRHIYAVTRVGRDTDVVIRQGKDLVELNGSLDVTGAVTRIVPVGQTKQGEPLYLPEVYVENEAEGAPAYALVKWGSLKVSDAKVGKNGMTTEQAYTAMREAARAEFDKGCDQPAYTLDVDFVNLGETLEYKDYGALYDLGIGDSVRVVCPSAGIDARLRLTDYVYDCLSRRYLSCKLGTVEDYTSAITRAAGASMGGGGFAGTAAYQPASEATTIAALRTDFNALLSALQRAGLMKGSG